MLMPHWPVVLNAPRIYMGLDVILKLLNKLGNPHKFLAPTIHVAGTNGKGSTIAFMKAIFQAAGYKVDRYISPHLIEFNERIQINGRNLSDKEIFNYIEKCRIAANELKIDPTFFEGTTAAAFLALANSKSDVLLLETGMGGRLDATNVVENPIASVITPISFDHVEHLGNTIELIASEKAGIIKKNSNLICTYQDKEALKVIEHKANVTECNKYIFGKNWGVIKNNNLMRIVFDDQIEDYPMPGLCGDHQLINAAAAIVTVKSLKQYNITKQHIIEGLKAASWPGRLQEIKNGAFKDLFHKEWQIWFDGAHNEAGGYILNDWLENENKKEEIPTVMICGMTEGKFRIRLVETFKNNKNIHKIFTVMVQNEPKAKRAERLAEEIKNIGLNVESSGILEEAAERICKEFKDFKKLRVLICGSLYLYTDIYKIGIKA